MSTPATHPAERRLMVFSHPNHELAVYGFCRRYRPHFVFLTDGGGERRVAETRAGLAAAGLEGRARFLNHPESALYEALLDGDTDFYRGLARQLAEAVEAVRPDAIYCDAVELYNPVHDMALPVTLAAAPGFEALYEVPLIYEEPADRGRGSERRYRVQRATPDRERISIELAPEELEAKRRARDEIYRALHDDLGATIDSVADDDLAREELCPAQRDPATPPARCALRYERRGRLLRERGEVERVITHGDQYRPLVTELLS